MAMVGADMDAKAAAYGGHRRRCTSASCPIFRGRILSGEWPPGHRIPFEYELSADLSMLAHDREQGDVANLRATRADRTAQAVRQLCRRPKSQAAILEIHDIRAEVEALGLPYRYERVPLRLRKRRGSATPAFRQAPRW